MKTPGLQDHFLRFSSINFPSSGATVKGKSRSNDKARVKDFAHGENLGLASDGHDDLQFEGQSHAPGLASPSHGFPLIQQLPTELQSYLITFVPLKSLCKGLARTSRYWADIVDAHIRRELLQLVGTEAEAAPTNQLMFEAQRPIDTITHKHPLWFSHFGVTNSTGGAYTTTANFVFLPPESVATDRDGACLSLASEVALAPYSYQNRGDAPIFSSARMRGVPEQHLGRLREEHHTSSVLPSASNASQTQQPATQDGGPSGSLARDQQPHSLEPGLLQALDAYDWAGPVSSTVAERMRSRSRSSSSGTHRASSRPATQYRRRAPKTKPTYRMQLDPLDSFETWILSLSVRTTCPEEPEFNSRSLASYESFAAAREAAAQPVRASPTTATGPSGRALGTAMQWEKRLAEGLDRIYRDWFQRPDVAQMTQDQLRDIHIRGFSVTPELISTFGAVNSAVDPKHTSRSLEEKSTTEDTDDSVPAPPRTLEFDNPSCQLHLQPHVSLRASSQHPALLSNYSHNYLSSSPFSYSAFNNSQRVELTWHAEKIEMNAGRLLCVLQELSDDMDDFIRARVRRRRMEQDRMLGQPQANFLGAGLDLDQPVILASSTAATWQFGGQAGQPWGSFTTANNAGRVVGDGEAAEATGDPRPTSPMQAPPFRIPAITRSLGPGRTAPTPSSFPVPTTSNEEEEELVWPPEASTDLQDLIAASAGQDQAPAPAISSSSAGGSSMIGMSTWFARGNRQAGHLADTAIVRGEEQ